MDAGFGTSWGCGTCCQIGQGRSPSASRVARRAISSSSCETEYRVLIRGWECNAGRLEDAVRHHSPAIQGPEPGRKILTWKSSPLLAVPDQCGATSRVKRDEEPTARAWL